MEKVMENNSHLQILCFGMFLFQSNYAHILVFGKMFFWFHFHQINLKIQSLKRLLNV